MTTACFIFSVLALGQINVVSLEYYPKLYEQDEIKYVCRTLFTLDASGNFINNSPVDKLDLVSLKNNKIMLSLDVDSFNKDSGKYMLESTQDIRIGEVHANGENDSKLPNARVLSEVSSQVINKHLHEIFHPYPSWLENMRASIFTSPSHNIRQTKISGVSSLGTHFSSKIPTEAFSKFGCYVDSFIPNPSEYDFVSKITYRINQSVLHACKATAEICDNTGDPYSNYFWFLDNDESTGMYLGTGSEIICAFSYTGNVYALIWRNEYNENGYLVVRVSSNNTVEARKIYFKYH